MMDFFFANGRAGSPAGCWFMLVSSRNPFADLEALDQPGTRSYSS